MGGAVLLPSALMPGLPVLRRLLDAGHEAYFVGGAVRDHLLGRSVRDIDIATSASAEETAQLFARVKEISGKFKTAVAVVRGRIRYDILLFGKPSAGRSILECLDRFDFTINCLAQTEDGTILDPLGGRADLAERRLTTVLHPDETFSNDAVRILRGLRFSHAFGLTIMSETMESMRRCAAGLEAVSRERIRDEVLKLLGDCERPSAAFRRMHELGALPFVLPELEPCFGFPQNKHHEFDVAEHSLLMADLLPAGKPLLRWYALMHDLGKPASCAGYGTPDASFIGHEKVSEGLAQNAMSRLRFSGQDTARVCKLVRNHMWQYRPEVTDAALRRFIARLGLPLLEDFLAVKAADRRAKGKLGGGDEMDSPLRRRIDDLLRRSPVLGQKDLAVDGADVKAALGLSEGPAVGQALKSLLALVLEDPSLNTREELLRRLCRMRA